MHFTRLRRANPQGLCCPAGKDGIALMMLKQVG